MSDLTPWGPKGHGHFYPFILGSIFSSLVLVLPFHIFSPCFEMTTLLINIPYTVHHVPVIRVSYGTQVIYGPYTIHGWFHLPSIICPGQIKFHRPPSAFLKHKLCHIIRPLIFVRATLPTVFIHQQLR